MATWAEVSNLAINELPLRLIGLPDILLGRPLMAEAEIIFGRIWTKTAISDLATFTARRVFSDAQRRCNSLEEASDIRC
ncbi:hypothetical protein HJB88_25855 [Rhizobium sp. NZLR5]|jgi:hypothetical protein|uniref:hypothetical protein n=1 Tax=Rhizobium sp. NZLR5 TaxID=2731103 RepID=UPI001C82FAE8|nr:hypothetical protein [Rhizobium sp. NZLR5]MBX5186025.1 hypothetical protein [Rhizobium sp. NZLR5]